MTYRAEIDGLRAVAVVPVMMFHADFDAFGGGFVGVDVFFVISGYLITRLLLEDRERGTFSVTRFWARRARRLLPALFVVMLACVPFAWLWMLPGQFENFTQSLIAAGLFASNFLFWSESGYFTLASEQKPLLHTWSLAIEGQFYLVFPLFMLLAGRFGRRTLIGSIAVLALASLAVSEWGAARFHTANFFLAPGRIWELLAGSLCAFAPVRAGRRVSNLLSLAGLAMIVVSVALFDRTTPFPSLYTLLPVTGTALILLFGQRGTWVAAILSLRLPVGIGLVSYSAYLWHQPLFAFARIRSDHPPDGLMMAGLIVLAFGLAYVTWRTIEIPFRRPGSTVFLSGPRMLQAASACLAAMAALAVFSDRTDGRERLWLASAAPETREAFGLFVNAWTASFRQARDDGVCRFDAWPLTDEVKARLQACYHTFGPGVAILGDSHAQDIFEAAGRLDEAPFLFAGTLFSCRPYTTNLSCHYKDFRAFVAANPAVFGRVIYHQAGPSLLLDSRGRPGSRKLFLVYGLEERVPDYAVNHARIVRVVSYLEKLARHTEVVWLGPRLEPHIPRKLMLRKGCRWKYGLRGNQSSQFERLDAAIAARLAAAERPHALRFASANRLLGLDLRHDYMNCDRLYWLDGDHWSVYGEARFAPRLKPLFGSGSAGRAEGPQPSAPVLSD